MNRTLEEIYASISQMIFKGIEGTFSDAVLEVQLHSLALKLSGGYLRGDGSAPTPFSFAKDDKKILMNDLIELHIKTHLDDSSRWNMLNFGLHPTGEYKVDFEWDEPLAECVERVYAEA
jgi:hypothetical protein